MAEVARIKKQMQKELGGPPDILQEPESKEEDRMTEKEWEDLVEERAQERQRRKQQFSSGSKGPAHSVANVQQSFKYKPKSFHDGIPKASEDDVKQLIASYRANGQDSESTILIDVREENEFELSKLYGAKNIPFSRVEAASDLPYEEFLSELGLPEKGDKVILYCQSGIRAGRVAMLLAKKGLSGARILDQHLILCRELRSDMI
mmetsp:Transcript_20976/g.31282  ORF Transcript_20976/g.31282 Transcript_20976/m.31282 type:complete len:205 (-) Transcript_20976:174-788(-)